MIKKSKIRWIMAYYKPLEKYFAGLGYKKDDKYFMRAGTNLNFDIWLDNGFERIRATRINTILGNEAAKLISSDWKEPAFIGPASDYVKKMMGAE